MPFEEEAVPRTANRGWGRRREEGGSRREIEEAALSKRGAFDISRGS